MTALLLQEHRTKHDIIARKHKIASAVISRAEMLRFIFHMPILAHDTYIVKISVRILECVKWVVTEEYVNCGKTMI